MPYVIPNLPSVGNFPSVTDYDTAMNDIIWLATGRPLDGKVASPSFALSSTAMVAINTTTLRVTITTSHAAATVLVVGTVGGQMIGSSANYWLAGLLIDGASQGDLGATGANASGNSASQSCSFASVFAIATASSHTFDLAARVTGGSATLNWCSLAVVEVK